MSGYFVAEPRPLVAADVDSARALVKQVLGNTQYESWTLELLDDAADGDPETRGALIERDGTVAALAVYGPVSGARGTWHIRVLLLAPRVDARTIGQTIVEGVVAEVRNKGGRLLVAELPGDPLVGRSLTALRANGFGQDGRVKDLYRDGVALLFLRREL